MELTTEQVGKLSPMMQQYLKTKEEHKGYILFYRLGDFYEMFFDDAILVSTELELTLTGKSCGLDERAPMCGVPFHAADTYIARLVKKGYKVAIGEQVEDPKEAKGLVKREVVRLITPGTLTDSDILDESSNNYICALAYISGVYGMAFADISTGEFMASEFEDAVSLGDELLKISPSEVVCNEAFLMSSYEISKVFESIGVTPCSIDTSCFSDEVTESIISDKFREGSLDPRIDDMACARSAVGALLSYLYETQKNDLPQIRHLDVYESSNYMRLDSFTLRNLELIETMRDKEKKGSLLGVLDKTRTAMGARLLREWIRRPLLKKSSIEKRLDALEDLSDHVVARDEIREYMGKVYDLERLMTRISYRTANPRDLLAFLSSISVIPAIRIALSDTSCKLLSEIRKSLDPLEDLCGLIDSAICEDPAISVREGGIIRDGFSDEVDELRRAKTDGKQWLAKLVEEEKEKTGIKNLRINYNRVFGYYLEVTNSFKDLVPDYYVRKQTLANSERYYTPELKELEDKILGAEERLSRIEYELYMGVIDQIISSIDRIQKTASALSRLDALCSLSYVSAKQRYVRPSINNKGVLDIHGGRHPVVETMMGSGLFVPNDLYLDNKNDLISVITGPNMAGKSTYMRQCALITLMAHMGCFVPAESADICLTDQIFTRVGASDDLASGQSTFMVEMSEMANILANATSSSLIILDEIGRGTSTFDGLAIAWSVVEYISDRSILGAKTLFATHYHELTELEGKLTGVKNYCIAVKENEGDIVFLRRIIPGGTDRSYGVEVARLAGVPEEVLRRAKQISQRLSENDLTEVLASITDDTPVVIESTSKDLPGQMSFMDTVSDKDIINELLEVSLDSITPIKALNILSDLQQKVKNRW